jgi:thiosulfate/3-mercaptopyruvate sulfurtransferase
VARLPLLVSPAELHAALGDPALRVLDATVWLTLYPDGSEVTIESGRTTFEQGHVPGAGFADLVELSDPERPAWLMLAAAERFAAGMSRLGVGPGTHVVAYDAVDGIWAARLWWMLRVFGFDEVSVLDGGFRAWCDMGGPVSTQAPGHPPAQRFDASLRPELLATAEDVERHVLEGGTCLVNALDAPLFRGDVPIAHRRAGRIPGSVNVAASGLIDPATNRFLPEEEVRRHFEAAGVLGERPIVAYCGGGIAASFDALALALIGRDDVAVYDGSLVEWAEDPERPLETG